jgi:hypothetical protein
MDHRPWKKYNRRSTSSGKRSDYSLALEPLERDIEKQIIQILKLMHIVVRKTHGDQFHKPVDDIVDLVGWIPPWGWGLAIEVKKPGEHATDKQKAMMQEVTDAGGLAFECSAPEIVPRLIREFEKGKRRTSSVP